MIYQTPISLTKKYLLDTEGLSDRDIYFIQKNLDIDFSRYEVILRGIPVHLQEYFSEHKEDQINRWVKNLPYTVSSQVKDVTAELVKLGLPPQRCGFPAIGRSG